MLRMALEYLKPGMQLGRDIYGADGRVILAAGATLTERGIGILQNWEVMSVYVVNPLVEITNLVEISRAYESVSRMVENTNDLSRRAVERLGKAA